MPVLPASNMIPWKTRLVLTGDEASGTGRYTSGGWYGSGAGCTTSGTGWKASGIGGMTSGAGWKTSGISG